MEEMTKLLGSGVRSMHSNETLRYVKNLPKKNQVKVLVNACNTTYTSHNDSLLSLRNKNLMNTLGVIGVNVTHNLKPDLILIAKYAKENYIEILSHAIDNTRYYQSDRQHIPQLLTLITGSIK